MIVEAYLLGTLYTAVVTGAGIVAILVLGRWL